MNLKNLRMVYGYGQQKEITKGEEWTSLMQNSLFQTNYISDSDKPNIRLQMLKHV